jgi:cobalt/nickel transport system permease protein
MVLTFLVAALLTGGILSLLASENPDGLEWSIAKVTGGAELKGNADGLHGSLAALQERLSFLPDYTFRKPEGMKPEISNNQPSSAEMGETRGNEKKAEGSRFGTSVAGIIGGLLTLGVVCLGGYLLKKRVHPV